MNKKKLERLKADETMVKRAALFKELLQTVPGVNVDEVDLVETPWRMAKMWDEIFVGYKMDGKEILEEAMFEDPGKKNLVVVKDIDFFSNCSHHIAPFFGTVTIAYIPQDGRIVGLSKLARLVDVHAKRLQVQEKLGEAILQDIKSVMNPFGVAVIIKAQHTCMSMRGVQKVGATTVTSALDGVFYLDEKARAELMHLIDL